MIVESKLVELYNQHRNFSKYVAVGVNVFEDKGEEQVMIGRFVLYDIADGAYQKIFDSGQLKGVISMIHSIDGTLIIGEGSKVSLYQYIPTKDSLNKVAIIDTKNYISCSKLKTKFLIIGDIMNSVTWLKFDNSGIDLSLRLIDNDTSNYSSTAIEFWLNDIEEPTKHGCVLSDDEGRLHVFQINPEMGSKFPESCNIYLGKKIIELTLISQNNKYVNCYAALDGSIGIVRPVSKDTFKKLYAVTESIFEQLPFRGGVNPMQFFESGFQYFYKKELGNFLDLEILNYYLYLPITTQKLIAKNLVLTRDAIIQSINEIKNN
jgi:hypothetical protein